MDRGIILAAGRGSRMGNATSNKPKCLTTLAGRSLLDWQIEAMVSADVRNITIVRGYKADMIQGDYELIENKRWKSTNMVASLFCVQAFQGNSLISYSDIVYKSRHIEQLLSCQGDITITADTKWRDLWELRFDEPLKDAESFKSRNNILLEIGQKVHDIEQIEAQYMGLLKLSEQGWKTMYELYKSFPNGKRDKIDMTTMLNELLAHKVAINVLLVDGGWCEVDSYSDVLIYENKLRSNKKWKHDWRDY